MHIRRRHIVRGSRRQRKAHPEQDNGYRSEKLNSTKRVSYWMTDTFLIANPGALVATIACQGRLSSLFGLRDEETMEGGERK